MISTSQFIINPSCFLNSKYPRLQVRAPETIVMWSSLLSTSLFKSSVFKRRISFSFLNMQKWCAYKALTWHNFLHTILYHFLIAYQRLSISVNRFLFIIHFLASWSDSFSCKNWQRLTYDDILSSIFNPWHVSHMHSREVTGLLFPISNIHKSTLYNSSKHLLYLHPVPTAEERSFLALTC